MKGQFEVNSQKNKKMESIRDIFSDVQIPAHASDHTG